ncbi:MAG: alpha/beta hydrolase [Acidimicrobiia bacterium]
MPLISIADGALFAHRYGAGPPRILALHGWGRRGSDFAPVLEGLDALALDLPGFGASPPPDVVLGAHGYAEMMAPALELFDRPPLIVGHSFGGRVAVALEADHPGSSAALVLAGVPLLRGVNGRKRPALAYRAIRAAHRLGLVSDERLERERQRHGSADYRAVGGIMRDVLVKVVNESYEEELARLEVRVYMVWGEDDPEVPVSVARRAVDLINEGGGYARLEVLAGVGHLLPLADPAALRRAVVEMVHEVGG